MDTELVRERTGCARRGNTAASAASPPGSSPHSVPSFPICPHPRFPHNNSPPPAGGSLYTVSAELPEDRASSLPSTASAVLLFRDGAPAECSCSGDPSLAPVCESLFAQASRSLLTIRGTEYRLQGTEGMGASFYLLFVCYPLSLPLCPVSVRYSETRVPSTPPLLPKQVGPCGWAWSAHAPRCGSRWPRTRMTLQG
jgi:hypothetical protein